MSSDLPNDHTDAENPYSPTASRGGTEANNLGDEQPRQLHLTSASAIVAASMIGAGVYTTSGYAIGALDSAFWVVVAWMVAGMIAVCGAICYGALASAFTQSGGEYLFLSRTVHPVAGLMAGWVSLLAGFTGAIAFAATTFAKYLSPLISGDGEPVNATVLAIGLVLVAAVTHSIGVRVGAIFQDITVVVKIVLIAAFIGIAIWYFRDWPRSQFLENAARMKKPEPTFTAFSLAFATQLMWMSLSYSGFNAAVYVAGEVKDPKRNVPRALVMGTVVVTLIYVLLNAVFVYSTPRSDINFQPEVAAIAARSIAGANFETFIRIVIVAGLFTSVSALIMTGPRVYAKMADDGYLPRIFRFQGRAPIVSIWIQAALAIVVIWRYELYDLLKFLGFTLSVSAALTAATVFWLHGRSSDVRVPFFPIPPIIFVGGTLLTATLSAIDSPKQALVGVCTIAFGIVFYPLYLWRRNQQTDDVLKAE